MIRRVAAWLGVCLVACGGGTAWAAKRQAPPIQVTRLHCELVYMPQRHAWDREVTLHHSRNRLQAVEVDGVPVHTALDNERIQIDLDAGRWQSDLRGLVEGQGACKANP